MVGSQWPSVAVALAMGGTAVYCALRPAFAARTGRRTDRAGDGLDVLMSVAMIGMVLGAPSGSDLGWALVFVGAAAAFAVRAVYAYVLTGAGAAGLRWHGTHAVLAGAMAPMLLAPAAAAAPMGGMAHAGPGRPVWPVLVMLALAVVALLAVREIWTVQGRPSAALAPRSAAVCRLVMALAMTYLLAAM